MNASASKRIGLGLLGALLAGGLLLAACAAPEGRAHAKDPGDVVPCPFKSGPRSCLDERQDAIAAYTHALLWSVNGKAAHARKARGGTLERTMGPDLEVALQHYAVRAGAKLPYTRELVEKTRPAGTDDLFVAWETLTHGEVA
ncbi:hypothetical protein [Streptomyces sp. AP-93]|uniref:hypothetical protein n=1 Tax=Streptomyces sp. AP-93 TaxID=2929048 RepID=UPI001FAF0E9E|nr:hypothetical protein [Streptomyces sp. AP-93]MCJ0873374.1 hypothetical protein [Streptomyces sp. AP-93]